MVYSITPFGADTWEVTNNNGMTGGIYTTKELPHGLSACVHCKRPTRPDKTTKKDYAGTVCRVSLTCCLSCHDRKKQGIPLPGNDYTCARCSQKVNTSYTAHKGTGPSSGGLCRNCAHGQKLSQTHAQKKSAAPTRTNCTNCGSVLVRAPHKVGDGEKRLYRRNMDRKCYEKTLEDEAWIEHPPELAEWEAARRARAEKRLRVADALTVEYARRMALRGKMCNTHCTYCPFKGCADCQHQTRQETT